MYPVEIIRQAKKHVPPEISIAYDLRFMGVLMDISVRGCRISVKHVFNQDQLIKLDFSINRRDNITAIGKVKNSQIISGQGSNISVVFRQISNKAKNQIYSYIFNYA